MGALLVTLLLGASDVSVSVAPGVVCVEQARLVARLERQGLQVRAKSDRLAVRIELVGAKVVIRGVKRGGSVLERSVPAKVDDCAAIERVIVAMISSWSTSLPSASASASAATLDAGSKTTPEIANSDVPGRDAGTLEFANWSQPNAGTVAASLRDAGAMTVISLRDAGLLRDDGAITTLEVASLRDAGKTLPSLRDAGTTPGTSDAGMVVRSGENASLRTPEVASSAETTSLRDAGTTDPELAGSGEASSLRDAGTFRAGTTAPELAGSGETTSLRDAGTLRAGTTTPELAGSGETTSLRDAGTLRAGTTAPELAGSGETTSRRDAGTLRAGSGETNPLRAGTTTEVAGSGGPSASSRETAPLRDMTPGAGAIDAGPTTQPEAANATASLEDAGTVTETSGVDAGIVSATTFEIAALGGTSLGPTAAFTGRGQASLTLAFTHFGVSLDVGLESARARTVDPVTVTTSSQFVSLSGLVHFRPIDRLRLSLSLGVRVWRIAAETTGADDNATVALASFGGVAAGTATFRLVGPLSAQLSLYTSSRWRTERFNVANLGAVLELLPWEGGLLGGLVLEANFL